MTEYKNLWKKRFLGYWLYKAESQTLLTIGMIAFYFIWQILILGTTSLEEAISTLTVMSKVFGAFLIILWQISYNKSVFSISLTFGGTRHEALLGHQVGLWLEMAQLLLLNLGVDVLAEKLDCSVLPMTGYVNKIMFTLAILLLGVGIGEIGAVVTSHFGNKGMTVVGVLFGLICAIMCFVGIMLQDVLNVTSFSTVMWIILAVGVVFYAAGFVVEKRYIEKMEVR